MHASKQCLVSPVLTGGCNGLCDSATLMYQIHQDPNCTKAEPGEIPMLPSWYDYSIVGCIQMLNGSVSKAACQTDD